MGMITAVKENRMRVVPFALLALLGWLALNVLTVWEAMDPFTGFNGGYVGQPAASGYIGLAVMVIALLVSVYLYAEAGETGPTPERFPPAIMYYECDGCGEMLSVVDEGDSFVCDCPVCGEPTRWTRAFEGEGVSF